MIDESDDDDHEMDRNQKKVLKTSKQIQQAEQEEKEVMDQQVVLTKEEQMKVKALKRNLEGMLKNQNSLLPYRGSFITSDSHILGMLRFCSLFLEELRSAVQTGCKRNVFNDLPPQSKRAKH